MRSPDPLAALGTTSKGRREKKESEGKGIPPPKVKVSRINAAHKSRRVRHTASPGSLNRVPASAGVRAGMSPLPGGR